MTDPNRPRMPDPTALMGLSTAYWQSQVLLTANRIGLFAALGADRRGAAQIAEALGTAPRPTELFLRACVALGLIEETAEGFGNTAVALAYLVPGGPAYLGNAIRYSDNLYMTWGRLEAALREDRPQLPPAAYLGEDPRQTRDFVYGMHNRALGVGRALAQVLDLSGRERLLDVGGGPGTYSALLAQGYPNLRCTVLDLPPVVAIAAEIVASLGVSDRVRTLGGDYETTAFPDGNDVVLISGVFHRETEATCRDLIRRAHTSLAVGGLLAVSDVFTDETGNGPQFATLFGLNMRLTAQDGGVHRAPEVGHWMEQAGFAQVLVQPLPPPMPHRILIGTKHNEVD